MLQRFAIGWVIFVAVIMPAIAHALTPQASEWKGEYFEPRQGAIYFKVKLKNFPASQQSSIITSNVQITVTNLLKKTDFLISYELQAIDSGPRTLWKLPSGKYAISRIEMVDTAGVRRVWAPAKKRNFAIKRLCISNLGLWTLTPSGSTALDASFEMVPNSYRERGRKKDSSAVAILDGFNGLVQEKLAGKSLIEKAENNYESRREMRATLKFTRQIAMFYKLDLFRHNHQAKPIATVLSTYDPNLRTCYMDRLEFNDVLRGDVKFTFILSKETGTMSKLRHTGGTADDPKLIQCIFNELARIQFPVKENILGELTYTYDFR